MYIRIYTCRYIHAIAASARASTSQSHVRVHASLSRASFPARYTILNSGRELFCPPLSFSPSLSISFFLSLSHFFFSPQTTLFSLCALRCISQSSSSCQTSCCEISREWTIFAASWGYTFELSIIILDSPRVYYLFEAFQIFFSSLARPISHLSVSLSLFLALPRARASFVLTKNFAARTPASF